MISLKKNVTIGRVFSNPKKSNYFVNPIVVRLVILCIVDVQVAGIQCWIWTVFHPWY